MSKHKAKDIHSELMNRFKAPEGSEVESYYGTKFTKIYNEKNKIELLYDYCKDKEGVSTPLYIDDSNDCLVLIKILEKYSGKDKIEIMLNSIRDNT